MLPETGKTSNIEKPKEHTHKHFTIPRDTDKV